MNKVPFQTPRRRAAQAGRSAHEARVHDDGDFLRWQDAAFLKLRITKLIDGLRLFYGQA